MFLHFSFNFLLNQTVSDFLLSEGLILRIKGTTFEAHSCGLTQLAGKLLSMSLSINSDLKLLLPDLLVILL